MITKIYGLYNMKENEQCEYFGTREEIADYLGVKPDSVSAFLSRKKKRC